MLTVNTSDQAATQLSCYLDVLPLLSASVGYGSLGLNGSLGYEGKSVTVRGQLYHHALSTHPPARLVFQLDGRFKRFSCRVGLNDDVPMSRSRADFSVFSDGRWVAYVPSVKIGATPTIDVDIRGARQLELVVNTGRWDYCHAVWLDPEVSNTSDETLVDCLNRTTIMLPASRPKARRCIATVVSGGFASQLDNLLGSLYANGNCQDALVAVFVMDADAECRRVIEKYGAVPIQCARIGPLNSTVKAVLYSAANVIDADYFLGLDADMLVMGDLGPVFAALDACPAGSLLACREANDYRYANLGHALTALYGGHSSDIARIIGSADGESAYPLVVNDGLFAASRHALLALDSIVRRWQDAPRWVDEQAHIRWRNQFIFNLAMAHLRCGVELDPTYNLQVFYQNLDIRRDGGYVQATWNGRPARVLHFNGHSWHKYQDLQNLFAGVPDPLMGPGDGDRYGEFLIALRAWIGRYGVSALAWSFYGSADASSAYVRDPLTMPLLAALHYLIRANGCIRVFETGTARGVSAACLASAVIHRPGGRVVTFDPYVYDERADLWARLPSVMAACIEQRTVDSLEGMNAALAAGERYEAALLDSLHSADHVWAEFQLAIQLVCPGGLILIHDPLLTRGTVDQAIERIKAAGYGVVRLWAATVGIDEGDRLGLAVIENNVDAISNRDPTSGA